MPAKEVPFWDVRVSPLVVSLPYPTVWLAAIVCRFGSSVGKQAQNYWRPAGCQPGERGTALSFKVFKLLVAEEK